MNIKFLTRDVSVRALLNTPWNVYFCREELVVGSRSQQMFKYQGVSRTAIMSLAFGCMPSCSGNNCWPVTTLLAQHWDLGRQTWVWAAASLWSDSRGAKAQGEQNNLQLNPRGVVNCKGGLCYLSLEKASRGCEHQVLLPPMAPCLIWSQRALCRTEGIREPWPAGFSGILNLAGPWPCLMSSTWLGKWQSIKSSGWSRGWKQSVCWCCSRWEIVGQNWGWVGSQAGWGTDAEEGGQSSHTTLAEPLAKGLSCSATCHTSHGVLVPWWRTGCQWRHSSLLQLQISVTNNKPDQKIAGNWSGNLCFWLLAVAIRRFAAHSVSDVHVVFPVLVLGMVGEMVNSPPWIPLSSSRHNSASWKFSRSTAFPKVSDSVPLAIQENAQTKSRLSPGNKHLILPVQWGRNFFLCQSWFNVWFVYIAQPVTLMEALWQNGIYCFLSSCLLSAYCLLAFPPWYDFRRLVKGIFLFSVTSVTW